MEIKLCTCVLTKIIFLNQAHVAVCRYILYNGNDSRKKTFVNDLLFRHSRENVRDSLHKVINNWAHAHNEFVFLSMDS